MAVLAVLAAVPMGAGAAHAEPSLPLTAVATFRVPVGQGAEYYRVRLTEADDITTARRILSGEQPRMVPNGAIARGETDVNKGYTWHLDPERFAFTPYALSVCDVRPSRVDDLPFLRQLCPWSAQLKSLEFTR